MKNKNVLVLAVLAAASVQPVWACDLCSIYSATEAQGGGKGFYAGGAVQFTEFGTLQTDSQKVPGNGEYQIRPLSEAASHIPRDNATLQIMSLMLSTG